MVFHELPFHEELLILPFRDFENQNWAFHSERASSPRTAFIFRLTFKSSLYSYSNIKRISVSTVIIFSTCFEHLNETGLNTLFMKNNPFCLYEKRLLWIRINKLRWYSQKSKMYFEKRQDFWITWYIVYLYVKIW